MHATDRTPLIEAVLDEAVLSIESALNNARPRQHWHHGVERIRRKVLAWKELREEAEQVHAASPGGQPGDQKERADVYDLPAP